MQHYSGFFQAIGKGLLLAFLLVTAACTFVPETIVQTPLTAKPLPRAKPLASSGSIYQAQSYKPLFEDRRARAIGDTLTINITENTSAGKNGAGSSSKSGSVDASITKPIGLPLPIPDISLAANSAMKNEDKAAASASNNFNGNIGVTVIEVLENGNLVVAGEKQIAFDRGSEYVRFSGVINPDYITIGNNIPSSKVADARIEYRTGTHLDTAQVIMLLARFFLSFAPL
ncbi:MAG: flagellar basal body L-ring protein FlgH [Methylophilaceae bacterium]|nr:flagellar basal body L-ring protein FlgH [Methylophilaceae bacterium]